MKSIVQEGSTISKAVESAWQSAGKPQEFTVKVLEEPIHNFIGMTTRSAKVALFFKEVFAPGKPSHDKSDRFNRNDRNDRSNDRNDRSNDRGEKDTRIPRPKKQARTPRAESTNPRAPFAQPRDERPARGDFHSSEETPVRTNTRPSYTENGAHRPAATEPHEGPGFDGVFWTPEMITMANDWLQGSLVAMDMSNLNYSTEVNRLYFKVEFANPVNENVATERQVFRSFAMLLMQHMRNRLKRPLKGFKVVLSRGGVEVDAE